MSNSRGRLVNERECLIHHNMKQSVWNVISVSQNTKKHLEQIEIFGEMTDYDVPTLIQSHRYDMAQTQDMVQYALSEVCTNKGQKEEQHEEVNIWLTHTI